MNTIQAIIIDDEKHARESLSALVSLYCPHLTLVGEASTIGQGVKLIQHKNPELVFLDIAIGKESGFDLLTKIDQTNFGLIFTTAYSEFAIQAFKVNALDYLLKPIDPSDLQQAVIKFINTRDQNKQLINLIQTLHSEKPKHLAISTSEGITFVEISNIAHITGSGNYSTFTLMNRDNIMASKSLKHFENILPENQFFRSHQSHLVNLLHVKKILIQDGNAIELTNGDIVPLVRHRKEELLGLMQKI